MKNKEITIEMPCEKEKISSTIKKISEKVKKLDCHIDDLNFKIKVTSKEILANAVEHGCQHREGKIKIILEATTSKVSIKVIDPGNGFNWNNTEFNNPVLKEKGIGLWIVNKVANKIEFNEMGNKITVYFYST